MSDVAPAVPAASSAGAEPAPGGGLPAGEAILEAIPDPALILDGDGAILGANERARKLLLGAPDAGERVAPGRPGALAGRRFDEFVLLPESVVAHDGQRFSPVGEYEARLPGPESRRLAIVVGPLGNGAGSAPATGRAGYVALLHDLTREERRLQIRLTTEKLDAVSLLASGVAHEFNNIMASLYGFAQLAQQDAMFHDELVDAVKQYAERSREITRRLRALSPERTGTLELLSVPDVIEDVLARHSALLARAEIAVVRRIEPGLPATLAVREEIEEIFETLFETARHSIVKGGKITVEASVREDAMLIRVSDTSYGIPPENLTRVFEPFFAMKSTDGGPITGGLGLAVALSHVRRHGGEMWVESELGRGTTFSVRLPIRAERRQRQTADVPVERRRPELRSRTILAVDDEEPMLKLLESVLGGHHVIVAKSGEEAIAALRHGPFDYVILDLVLHGDMDGFEVFDELLRRDRSAKIILLTGRSEDERLKDYAARAYGYLRKPFGIKDVQSLVV